MFYQAFHTIHSHAQTFIVTTQSIPVHSPSIMSGLIVFLTAVALTVQLHAIRVEAIIGGQQGKITDVPWLVSIQYSANGARNFDHFCGGTIYSEEIIISAAHCFVTKDRSTGRFFNIPPNLFRVRAGVTNWEDESGQTVKIRNVTIHPDYDKENYYHDVAIVRLNTPLKLNRKTTRKMPILPDPLVKYTGKAIVSGWGYTDAETANKGSHQEEYFPKVLRVIIKDLLDISTCDRLIKENLGEDVINITDINLCAMSQKGDDSCQGDSGGPLICRQARVGFLCGVVSYGYGCGSKDYPGFYTNVAKNSRWILTTVNAPLSDSYKNIYFNLGQKNAG